MKNYLRYPSVTILLRTFDPSLRPFGESLTPTGDPFGPLGDKFSRETTKVAPTP